jgi:hypothetical protein
MASKTTSWMKWVRIACAIALLSIGFAHKPLDLRALSQVDMAAYTLPDGTIPDLCIPGDDGAGKTGHLMDHGCEACSLSASVLIPQPPAFGGVVLASGQQAVPAQRVEAFRQRLYPPGSGPRAPPQFLMS